MTIEEETASAPALAETEAGKAEPQKVACYIASDVRTSLPESVEKKGYVFMVWKDTQEVMPAADIKVTASMAVLGDANKDRKVSISDAVGVINIILNGNGTSENTPKEQQKTLNKHKNKGTLFFHARY